MRTFGGGGQGHCSTGVRHQASGRTAGTRSREPGTGPSGEPAPPSLFGSFVFFATVGISGHLTGFRRSSRRRQPAGRAALGPASGGRCHSRPAIGQPRWSLRNCFAVSCFSRRETENRRHLRAAPSLVTARWSSRTPAHRTIREADESAHRETSRKPESGGEAQDREPKRSGRQASGVRHQASGIRRQASGVRRQASGIRPNGLSGSSDQLGGDGEARQMAGF